MEIVLERADMDDVVSCIDPNASLATWYTQLRGELNTDCAIPEKYDVYVEGEPVGADLDQPVVGMAVSGRVELRLRPEFVGAHVLQAEYGVDVTALRAAPSDGELSWEAVVCSFVDSNNWEGMVAFKKARILSPDGWRHLTQLFKVHVPTNSDKWVHYLRAMSADGGREVGDEVGVLDTLLQRADAEEAAVALVETVVPHGVAWHALAGPYGSETIMHVAAAKGRCRVVEALAAAGICVNGRCDHPRSPLPPPVCSAIVHGQQDALRTLLRLGANPSECGPNGYTAMMCAALRGDATAVRSLLTAGADPDKQNQAGKTALLIAAEQGHTDVCRILIQEAAADPTLATNKALTPLAAAIVGQHRAIWEMLLARKDVDVNISNSIGRSLLQLAVEKRNDDLVEQLLTRGADVNHAGSTGITALMSAVKCDCLAIVRRLLDAGAEVDAQNDDDETALIIAASTNASLPVCELLVSRGADINACTNVDGETALVVAIKAKATRVAQYLIKEGADHRWATTLLSRNALHYAADKGNEQVCEDLLKAGADINGKDKRGMTPLVVAVEAGGGKTSKIAKFLLQKGASCDAFSTYSVSGGKRLTAPVE